MDKETYQLLPKLPQFGLGLVPLNENTLWQVGQNQNLKKK